MRILFTAYAFNKDGKSEAYSAYNIANSIRELGHQVRVLTRKHNADPAVVQLRPRFWSSKLVYAQKLKLDYFEFITRAYFLARKTRGSYDLIHHISPISFRYPNPLAGLGVPFIWGPIGGSISYPPGFGSVSEREPPLTRSRQIDRLRLRFDPTLRFTLKNAARIVVTSTAAQCLLPEHYQYKSTVIPYGITTSRPSDEAAVPGDYVFSSGRLVPYKALDLLIRAYDRSCTNSTKLLISGEGPERARLEALIQKLGQEDKVSLIGRVPRDENLRLMSGAKFCVFPALNEAFGHVNLEAMMLRKPIVVTDWGGPSDLVEDGVSGFKVLGKNSDQHVALLAERISRLLRDPSLCSAMGEEAHQRVVTQHSWEAIAGRYNEIYRSLANADQ